MDRGKGLVMGYALLIGIVLGALGLLGFFSNPIIGDAAGKPIFVTGTVHDLLLLIAGSLALYVAFSLRGDQQAVGVMAIGVLFLALFLLALNSADLSGLLSNPVNSADRGLHLVVGVASLAVGWYGHSSFRRLMPAR